MARWSYFAKQLLAQPLLFPRMSCRFLNPDLAFDHYTAFLQLLLWSAETQHFLAGFSHPTSEKQSQN